MSAKPKPNAPPGTSLAPSVPPTNDLALTSETMRAEMRALALGDHVSTLDERSREGARALFNALQTADDTLIGNVGRTLEIVHVVCHRVERVNELTGETTTPLRTVLICADGKVYSTGSDSVRRGVFDMANILRQTAPFSPPLRVTVAQKRSTKNASHQYLYLVFPEANGG